MAHEMIRKYILLGNLTIWSSTSILEEHQKSHQEQEATQKASPRHNPGKQIFLKKLKNKEKRLVAKYSYLSTLT